MVDLITFFSSHWEAILTIGITIILTVGFFYLGRNKALSYTKNITELVSVKDEVKSDLKITYKGEPIEKLQLVKINLMNTGFIDIKSDDFEEPIKIDFGVKSEIFDIKVMEKDPDDINVEYKKS